jgi:hypothetical protein
MFSHAGCQSQATTSTFSTSCNAADQEHTRTCPLQPPLLLLLLTPAHQDLHPNHLLRLQWLTHMCLLQQQINPASTWTAQYPHSSSSSSRLDRAVMTRLRGCRTSSTLLYQVLRRYALLADHGALTTTGSSPGMMQQVRRRLHAPVRFARGRACALYLCLCMCSCA